MYLETHKCVTCKAQLTREEVIIAGRNTLKDGTQVIYYRCLPCNLKNSKRYNKTEHGRKKQYEAVYRSIKKFPERQNARLLLNQAVKKGKIIRPTNCPICESNTKVEGHHTDYSRPIDVVWCCRDCHRLLDRNN